MIEFLKSYGVWIVLGVFILLMLVRSRGHAGGGCGMGGHQHGDTQNPGEEKKEEQHKHSGCC